MSLDKPVGWDERKEDDWTPARGYVEGLVHGLLGAVVLALVLWPLAACLPYMVLIWWLRSALAFGLTYVMLCIAQRGAGMVNNGVSAVAVSLAALVLLSHHAVFAYYGVLAPFDLGVVSGGGYGVMIFPTQLLCQIIGRQGDLMIGWRWFHPYALLAANAGPVLGIAFALMLRGRG
jgi:hypothetical protein